MASCPIISWQIDGETVETVVDFVFWGSKITADGDCSHEIKRHLLLGKKIMTNLSSVPSLSRVRLFVTPWIAVCQVLSKCYYCCCCYLEAERRQSIEKWRSGERKAHGRSKTPWTVAHQAPPSMGFSRQEYWSGVPLPSLNGILLSH